MTEKEILIAVGSSVLSDHVDMSTLLQKFTREERQIVQNILEEFGLYDILQTRVDNYAPTTGVKELLPYSDTVKQTLPVASGFDELEKEEAKMLMTAQLEQVKLFLAGKLSANPSTRQEARKFIEENYVTEFVEKYPGVKVNFGFNGKWTFTIDVSEVEPLLAATIVPVNSHLYKITVKGV
jgi:hypothetical protein